MATIRVLVVDDSVVIRRLLTTIIEEDDDLEVAGIAPNGVIALQRIEQLRPDIVTLDVEMPELDGLGTLKRLRPDHPSLPVVMFSTLTERGAAATLDALSAGASDYVTKPANVGSVTVAMERVREELIPKLKALVPRGPDRVVTPAAEPARRSVAPTGRVDVVAIGSSTGGPNALADVLRELPADLGVPFVVTQHMPPVFTGFLAERIEPGTVHIAPGDHHMRVRRRGVDIVVETDQGPQVQFCRPSVDVLFSSVADVYGGDALAVVLTGMGGDGRDGCGRLHDLGAHVVVQDEASSVVWGMPGAVAAAGYADEILPLGDIAPSIGSRVGPRALTPRRTA